MALCGVMREFCGILVTLVLLVGLAFSPVGLVSEGYLIVVGDTCGYEVAVSLVERYGINAVVIPYSQLSDVPSDMVLVVLFTNATPSAGFEHVSELLNGLEIPVVVTDVFYNYVSNNRGLLLNIVSVISTDNTWQYCLYHDEISLAKIEIALRVRPGLPVFTLLAVVAGVIAVASSLHFNPDVRELFRSASRRLLLVLLGSLSLLHMKIRREELFNHPIRVEIVRIIYSRGEATFSELMKEIGCSRATLEWHLSILIRAKAIEEVRVGRKRVYRIGVNGVYIFSNNASNGDVRKTR